MDLRELDLNLLVLFETIYEEQNLTNAAKRMRLGQPAISSALSRLREMLDDPLFIRTRDGMIPNDRAKQLIEPIRSALTTIHNAVEDRWAFDFKDIEHSFHISMSDYSECIILPKLMDWIGRVAPHVSVKIHALDDRFVARELQKGEVDLVIGHIKSMADYNFKSEPLITEDFMVIARNDHPVVKNSISLKQYASIPHAVTAPRLKDNIIDDMLAERGLKRFIALQVPDFLSIPSIVENTNTIATVPLRVAQKFLKSHNMKMLKPPLNYSKRVISQYWDPQKEQIKENIWLRRSISSICRQF